jgi:hypothetical protein
MKNIRSISYVNVNELIPIEGHDPERVLWLKDKIVAEGRWTVPLKVEKTLRLVMDGHHRFEVAKLLGLRRVPAEYFSYNEVDVWTLRDGIEVNPQIIFDNFSNGVIFPYKTAKHEFFGIEPIFGGVPINDLKL